jgi:hypothetical protein
LIKAPGYWFTPQRLEKIQMLNIRRIVAALRERGSRAVSPRSLDAIQKQIEEVRGDLYTQLDLIKQTSELEGQRGKAIQDGLQRSLDPVQTQIEQVRSELHTQLHLVKQTLNMEVQRSSDPYRGNKKVLFLVSNIEAWDGLNDLYFSMVAAADFHPVVASINRRFPPAPEFVEEEFIHSKLQDLGVPHIRLGMSNSYDALEIIKALAPDIIFRQTHSDEDVPPAFSTSELRFAKLCYVQYEMTSLVRNEALTDGSFDLTTDGYYHRSCWRIFSANDYDRARFVRGSALAGMNVVVTGHPKAQRLLSRSEHWPINRDGASYKLFWSAHHSIGDDWYKFGMFHHIWRDMLKWASARPTIDFVFSPHPALKAQTEVRSENIQKAAYPTFIEEWNKLPNTAIFRGGDYGGVMRSSSAMLIDGISQLAEYQLFDKPVIFLERPEHLPFNDLGEKVRSASCPVSNVQEAMILVDRLAAGEIDPKHGSHTAVAAEISIYPDAVDRILAEIRGGLNEMRP